MEKKKYELDIAGVQMAVISDEREELVNRLAADIDESIRNITLRSKHCSKLDAAILTALEYAGDKLKAEKRVRNLEAQVALYDANLRRMKEENAKLKGESTAAVPRPMERAVEEGDQLSMLEDIDEPFKAEPSESALHTEETVSADTSDKLRRVEELLRRRPEGAPEDKTRDDKLRQIESLLKGKE